MTDARAEGRAALAALDRALAARPVRDAEAFGETTGRLCAVRDLLIRRAREGGGRPAALDAINGLVSAVLAGQFPSGPVRWDMLSVARTALADLVATLDASPVP